MALDIQQIAVGAVLAGGIYQAVRGFRKGDTEGQGVFVDTSLKLVDAVNKENARLRAEFQEQIAAKDKQIERQSRQIGELRARVIALEKRIEQRMADIEQRADNQEEREGFNQ